MCAFLTLAIPAHTAGAIAREPAPGLYAAPQANRSLAAHLGGRAAFLVTAGGCSCGLYVPERARSELDAARRKYEKRGWTEAKIARALHGRRGVVGLRDDVRELVARLAETTGEVGVFVHVYSGDVQAEDVGAPVAGLVAIPAALRSGSVTIAPDALTWIRVT